jgi:ferric enterobactin receptor
VNCSVNLFKMRKAFTSACSIFFTIFIFNLLCSKSTIAQADTKFYIKGKLADSVSGKAIAYASIELFNAADKKLVSGSIAADDGGFSIETAPGTYYLLIEFMGYKSHKTNSFTLSAASKVFDLGILRLSATVKSMDEIIVQAEKSTMELSLDKRVFNVGKDLANAGGTASDILMNIPSVSVDGEGAVQLRGSGNVRILIDGKPSGLVSINGGSGLQQLQASMIERVEVITNPSARYEAEGMAGIINIILKKGRKRGINGSFDIITGQPVNYGLAANVNFRQNKINFFINYSIAYRIQPYVGKLYQEVYSKDTTFILKQDNKGKVIGFNNNIRGGLDYFFSEKSILTAAYLFRRSDADRETNIRYEDYVFNDSKMTSYTLRKQEETEDEPNSEIALTWKRSFAKKGHELTADIRYLDYWEKSDQVFTQDTYSPDGSLIPGTSSIQNSVNDEFEKQYVFQTDYTHPLGSNGKFEAGLRSSFRDMVNDYLVTEQDAAGQWVPLPGLDNYFIYNENIQALYGIYGDKKKKFSYQLGLRAEWTNVKTTLQQTNEVNPRKYANLFPSGHLSFDIGGENALQLSYSRRVRRPVYNELSPYFTFSDSRNFTGGNPNLNPEYTDVYELGHIKNFEKGSVSSSIYFRNTTDKILYIREVDAAGNSVNLPQNLIGEKSMGAELVSSYSPEKWVKLDYSINFFRAITDGSNIDEQYKSDTYSWFTRLTSRFTLPQHTDLQLRANYEAPQKTPQGERKALYYFDIAASRDLLKNRATLTLNILDVLNSRRNRYITRGENFYTNGDSQFRRRQVNLTFNYRLNQAKSTKKSSEE